MRPRQWLALASLCALVMALVGCASASVSQAKTATPQRTPLATATSSTVMLDPTQSPTAQASGNPCAPHADWTRIGDLVFANPYVLYGFNADYMLPAGSSTKPVAVTLQNNGWLALGGTTNSLPVVQGGAFVVEVCNTSATQSHHLTTFGVRLDSLTAYTEQLNALNGCAFLYGRPSGWGGECASGFSPDVELSFAFATTATPPATLTQSASGQITVPPGREITVDFGVKPPSGSATSTYRLGVGVDGAAIVYPTALATQPTINALIARRWAGTICATPTMQAQIPASIPAGTYYTCPQA